MGGVAQASSSEPRPSDALLTVVKLGGSVVRGGTLAGWLDVIAEARRVAAEMPSAPHLRFVCS